MCWARSQSRFVSSPTWTARLCLDRPRRRLRRSNWRDGVHPGKRGPTGGTRSKQGAGAGTGAGSRGPPRRPAAQVPGRAAPGRRRASCSRQAAWRRAGARPPGGRPPAPAPVRVGPKCPRSAQTAPALPPAAGRALESCGFSIGPRGCRRPLCRTRTPPQAPTPPHPPHHAGNTHHTLIPEEPSNDPHNTTYTPDRTSRADSGGSALPSGPTPTTTPLHPNTTSTRRERPCTPQSLTNVEGSGMRFEGVLSGARGSSAALLICGHACGARRCRTSRKSVRIRDKRCRRRPRPRAQRWNHAGARTAHAHVGGVCPGSGHSTPTHAPSSRNKPRLARTSQHAGGAALHLGGGD